MNSTLTPQAATNTTAPRASRIPSLDGLRGIAIAMVLIGHGAYSLPPELSPVILFFGNGALGVKIFFVLSGYLIYSLSVREIERTGTFDWKGFYARRVLRIFPCFYLYIGVLLLLAKLGVVTLTWPMFLSAGTFSLNYRHLWDPLDSVTAQSDYYVIGHYWTLSLEEQFYLTWPLLILLFVRRRLLSALLLVVFMAPILRVGTYFLMPGSRGQIGMMFHTAFDAIAAGVLLGELLRRDRSAAFIEGLIRKRWVVPSLILFLGMISPLITARLRGAYSLGIGTSLELASLCVVIAAAVKQRDSLLYRVLNWHPLTQVGVLSYSLYVWNNLFLYANGWAVNRFPLNFICVIIMALVSYHLVEKPALRFKDRFHPKSR